MIVASNIASRDLFLMRNRTFFELFFLFVRNEWNYIAFFPFAKQNVSLVELKKIKIKIILYQVLRLHPPTRWLTDQIWCHHIQEKSLDLFVCFCGEVTNHATFCSNEHWKLYTFPITHIHQINRIITKLITFRRDENIKWLTHFSLVIVTCV